jgi:hypothetical protein
MMKPPMYIAVLVMGCLILISLPFLAVMWICGATYSFVNMIYFADKTCIEDKSFGK